MINTKVRMPVLLSKNENQLSTQDANNSRFVTKLRWVVEVINSFLKNSFKALKQVPNISLPHTLEDYKIPGALIDRFFKRLFSDQNDEEAIVKNMLNKLNVDNELEEIVKNNKLHSKTKFVRLNSSQINDFPKLHLDAQDENHVW
jgi:hypothetical protein